MKQRGNLLIIIPIGLLVIVAILGGIYWQFFKPLVSFDPKVVPAITANPIDTSQVFIISQFRSGAGHDYSNSWDGETCRSMKHYFNMGQNNVNGKPVRSQPTAGHPNIKIYAPFDGTITANDQEQTPIGTQVHIASTKNPSYYVRLFHIDLDKNLKIGSKVTSGQQIGTIGPMDGMDVSYEANILGKSGPVLLSVFDYMTDDAFASYAAKGFKRSDFVLTRAQADVAGYSCNGEQFTQGRRQSSDGTSAGYVKLGTNPYETNNQAQQTPVSNTQSPQETSGGSGSGAGTGSGGGNNSKALP